MPEPKQYFLKAMSDGFHDEFAWTAQDIALIAAVGIVALILMVIFAKRWWR